MSKRHTIFGVCLPVWRAEKQGAGAATITFVLHGKLISKKNNQMAVVVKKDARKWVDNQIKSGQKPTWKAVESVLSIARSAFVGNAQYEACKKTFIPEIGAQMKVWEQRLGAKGLKFPLKKASLSLKFYFKKKHITDTVNKQQTIQDLLVDAGVIANDDYKTLNPIVAESGYYPKGIREDVYVARLSFQLPKKQVKLTDEIK